MIGRKTTAGQTSLLGELLDGKPPQGGDDFQTAFGREPNIIERTLKRVRVIRQRKLGSRIGFLGNDGGSPIVRVGQFEIVSRIRIGQNETRFDRDGQIRVRVLERAVAKKFDDAAVRRAIEIAAQDNGKFGRRRQRGRRRVLALTRVGRRRRRRRRRRRGRTACLAERVETFQTRLRLHYL